MKKLGFTLIELLIVIAIIGILAALIMTNVQGVRERARDARRKSDLQSIKAALRLYYNDQKSFPEHSSNLEIMGCGDLTTSCTWGSSSFVLNSSTYINTIPSDPSTSTSNTVSYEYYQASDDSYALITKLENLSDSDISDSQARCRSPYNSYKGSSSNEDTTRDYVVCE